MGGFRIRPLRSTLAVALAVVAALPALPSSAIPLLDEPAGPYLGALLVPAGLVDCRDPDFGTRRGCEAWVTRAGGFGHGDDGATHVATSPDGAAVYVAGWSRAARGGSTDLVVIAYDAASGAETWSRRYAAPEGGDESPLAIATSPDGARIFVLASVAIGPREPWGPAPADFAVLAYDSRDGSLAWVARERLETYEEPATALLVSPDGSRVLVVSTSSSLLPDLGSATVLAYEAGSGFPVGRGSLFAGSRATSAVLTADGGTLLVAGHSSALAAAFVAAVDVFSLEARRITTFRDPAIERFSQTWLTSVAVAPDGATALALGGVTRFAPYEVQRLALGVDVATGAVVWSRIDTIPLEHGGYQHAVGGLEEGAFFAVGFGRAPLSDSWSNLTFVAERIDAATGDVRWRSLEPAGPEILHGGWRTSVAWADGRLVVGGWIAPASAKPSGGLVYRNWTDFGAVAFDPASGERLWRMTWNSPKNYEDVGFGLAASPDGSTLYLAGRTATNAANSNLDATTLAFSATTGAPRWAASYDGPASASDDVGMRVVASPDGATVYLAAEVFGAERSDIAILAQDAATGATRWRFDWDNPSGGTDWLNGIVVDPTGARVFFSADSYASPRSNASVSALDAATGAPLWTSWYAAADRSAAISIAVSPDGATVYLGAYSSYPGLGAEMDLVAFDAATGATKWTSRYGSPDIAFHDVARDMVALADRVIVSAEAPNGGSSDAAFLAFAASDGTLLWRTTWDGPGGGWEYGGPLAAAPDGGRVFSALTSPGANGASGIATLALDVATGALLWSDHWRPLASLWSTSRYAGGLAVTADRVYVTGGYYSRDLLAYDAATGARLFVAETGEWTAYDIGRRVHVAPDGSRVVVSGGGCCLGGYATTAHDARDGSVVWAAEWRPDPAGTHLATASTLVLGGARVVVTGVSWGDASTGTDAVTLAYDVAGGRAVPTFAVP